MRRGERVESELEELFERQAAPLSQLRMQAGLMENGQDVDAQDVMALGRKLANAIEEAGLEPIGSPGGTLEFDPDLARPLGAGPDMQRGDPVVVKFVGYRYAGRVIRKALVAGEE
jgi:molecular chaperone GrpE (heat shock protein)